MQLPLALVTPVPRALLKTPLTEPNGKPLLYPPIQHTLPDGGYGGVEVGIPVADMDKLRRPFGEADDTTGTLEGSAYDTLIHLTTRKRYSDDGT